MKKKIIGLFVSISLSLALFIQPAYAAGTARITIRDINNVIKCQATAPNTCTFNSLITGNFYTITLDDANGNLLSHADLIGGNNANLWYWHGYAVNYQGGTAPTCTYTATSTRWQASCNSGVGFPNTIQSVFLYGYPVSSATDDNGKGSVRQNGVSPSVVNLLYQTL
jgi:hypothetical protein